MKADVDTESIALHLNMFLISIFIIYVSSIYGCLVDRAGPFVPKGGVFCNKKLASDLAVVLFFSSKWWV